MISTSVMKKKNRKVNYVNNRDFLNALIEYRDQVISAKSKDVAIPRVPRYIGECLLKIATKLSYKPNYVNYSYKEDMISDSVENCLQYIMNFDPQISSNPFAYFTSIINRSFIRRIIKEKRQQEIKERILDQYGGDDVSSEDDLDNNSEFTRIKNTVSYKSRVN